MKRTTFRVLAAVGVMLVLVWTAGAAHGGLASHWTFDDAGTLGNDIGTFNNDSIGTTGSPAHTASAVVGAGALSLDGGSTLVIPNATDYTGMDGDGDGFTVAAWVYIGDTPARDVQRFFGLNLNGGGWIGRGFHTAIRNGSPERPFGTTAGKADYNTNGALFTDLGHNEWHHLAYRFKGNVIDSVDYFLDGNLIQNVNSGANGMNNAAAADTYTIGGINFNAQGGHFLVGRLDDLRVYDTEISDNEISALAVPDPVTHEVAGDNTIGTETLSGEQSNEQYGGAPTGRFVQVKNNGTSSRRMDIGEVEAFASGVTPTVDHAATNQFLNPSIDLAYSGSAAGASVYAKGADSGFSQPHGTTDDPELIDAREDDGWPVWSSNGVGNFVTIDLGDSFEIGTVRVHQRNGCCQDRLRDFSVNIFADDGTGNPAAQLATASYPGQPPNQRFAELSMAALTGADLTASLNPHDLGAGYTYVFELGSADMIEVENPDPSVFTTILDINDADIVVEALGPLTPGEVFQLLSADQFVGQVHNLDLPAGIYPVGDFNVTGAVTNVSPTGEIPEPMTMLAVGLGIAGLGGYVRKRRRA